MLQHRAKWRPGCQQGEAEGERIGKEVEILGFLHLDKHVDLAHARGVDVVP